MSTEKKLRTQSQSIGRLDTGKEKINRLENKLKEGSRRQQERQKTKNIEERRKEHSENI